MGYPRFLLGRQGKTSCECCDSTNSLQIVNLVSQEGTPFSSAASCHPAMVDAADAPKITIPILSIPSKDEDKDAHDKYEQALKVKKRVEWFNNDIHGFMAARSNLDNDSERTSYEKAYSILSDWFKETLSGSSKSNL